MSFNLFNRLHTRTAAPSDNDLMIGGDETTFWQATWGTIKGWISSLSFGGTVKIEATADGADVHGFLKANNYIATEGTPRYELEDIDYIGDLKYGRIRLGGGNLSLERSPDGLSWTAELIITPSKNVVLNYSGAKKFETTIGGAKITGNINISAMPTSASGLSSGDLWRDGDTVKIVL